MSDTIELGMGGVALPPPDADGLYDTQVILDALTCVEMLEVINEAIAGLALSLGIENARILVLDLQGRVELLITAMHPGRISPRMISTAQMMIGEWAGYNQDIRGMQAEHWEKNPDDKARFFNAEGIAPADIPEHAPRPLTRVIRMRRAHHDDPSS